MNDSSQRLSRISLTDDGPVLPAKGKDTTSQSQPGSAPRSVKSNDSLLSTDSSGQPHYNNGVPPPFLTIFAQDGELRPSRDSMISLTEMEHGWSFLPHAQQLHRFKAKIHNTPYFRLVIASQWPQEQSPFAVPQDTVERRRCHPYLCPVQCRSA